MNTGDAVTSVLSTDSTIVGSDHRQSFPVGRFAHFLPAGEGKDVVLAFDIPADVRPTLLRVDLLDGDSVEVDLTVP